MNRSNALTITRQEIGVSKHIPITHFNESSIFETEAGALGMVLKLEGVPFDVERPAILNQYKKTLHRAMMIFSDHFALYVTIHRHKESIALHGEFTSAFAREIDHRYHAQFKNSNMYINDIYLTVIFKGISSGKMGKSLSFMNRLKNKAIKEAREITRLAQIKSLKSIVNQLIVLLSDFKPRLLGEHDSVLCYSELLYFLSLSVNGGAGIKAVYPSSAHPIGKSMRASKKMSSLYPHGNLSQFLSHKRLFFGEYIQFQGATKDDQLFAAIVTIKRYGNESTNIMFDALLHLDSDFISTHSYAVEEKQVTLAHIKRHMLRMKNTDDPAVSQISALHEARDFLGSDDITMGYHHNTIMLLADSVHALEHKIGACVKCYADAGFIAVRETLGLEPAFWAQIPGNFKYIARCSLITSENFVDFSPIHNYQTGFSDDNHLGSAVTILETPSKTPYRFNFHVKGARSNPSKGHAIIIGGNNAGKTVLMTFLDAQMNRYDGHSFFFDRDRGAEIYIRAVNGVYVVLSPDYPENTHFAPLQLPDTPANRQFNRDLLIHFCLEKENDYLSADVIALLTQCIDYAFDHLAPLYRTLSNATKILPIDFQRWSSLRRWLKSDGEHHDGEYAYLFDHAEDQLQLHKKMGFDLTHFLDKEPSHIRTPLMMYLFHRIDLAIHASAKSNKNLTSVWLDEGWQYLDDPYWKTTLKKVLPTWRKKNAHIILATQSPRSVSESPIKHIIMDNVATQIYFSNPQAEEKDYIQGIKLTQTEYDTIRKNRPESRLLLIKQEHESVLVKLNLNALPDLLSVLSGNTASVALLDRVRHELGDDPKNWLPEFQKQMLEIIT